MDLLLGVYIQLDQAGNLKLVDFNPIRIGSKMEADSNELYNDLFEEVQASSNEDRDNDLVDDDLPVPGRLVAIQMVVLHRRKE